VLGLTVGLDDLRGLFQSLWFYDSWLWGWQSPGTGWPEGLWSLLLWRCSKPAQTWSCATCSRWVLCFGRGIGLDDPQRSLSTPTILWFCVIIFSVVIWDFNLFFKFKISYQKSTSLKWNNWEKINKLSGSQVSSQVPDEEFILLKS